MLNHLDQVLNDFPDIARSFNIFRDVSDKD